MSEPVASRKREVDSGFSVQDVICGVDGTPSAQEAARQAALIAGPDGHVHYLCVAHSEGKGLTAMATITARRAQDALQGAVEIADEVGTPATTEILDARVEPDALLGAAAEHDLLVVGSHGVRRGMGIFLGSVASTALHRASVPVLVSRRPPPDSRFPQRVLLAVDGSVGSIHAAGLAVDLYRRHGAHLTSINVLERLPPREKHVITSLTADLMRAVGVETILMSPSTSIADSIVELARHEQPSLIILGSRGLSGVRALGSVSERVAHAATCSVLVARGTAPEDA